MGIGIVKSDTAVRTVDCKQITYWDDSDGAHIVVGLCIYTNSPNDNVGLSMTCSYIMDDGKVICDRKYHHKLLTHRGGHIFTMHSKTISNLGLKSVVIAGEQMKFTFVSKDTELIVMLPRDSSDQYESD